jgi:hypothetical protein
MRGPGLLNDLGSCKQYHFRIPYHSVLVRVLESGQPKDYAFGVCCFSAKHATLRDKNKDRLAENHDIQEAECDDIFNICWIMFLLLILKMHCYFVLAFISIREWLRMIQMYLYHRWECLFVCLFDGVWCYFQQYFNYIVEVSFIVGGNRRTGENHRPVIFYYQMKQKISYRMVLGFTTTYAISAYHHWCSEFEPRSGWGVQHHVIKFVSDLRQVGGFLRKISSHSASCILLIWMMEINVNDTNVPIS